MIISLSQPKKPDKAMTMKHLRVFLFALLLLASPLLQGNITVSSYHFLDPDPDLHALAKRILFCSWTPSLFFYPYLKFLCRLSVLFIVSIDWIEIDLIWLFGDFVDISMVMLARILLCFCHSSSLLIYWLIWYFFFVCFNLLFKVTFDLMFCFAN